MWLRGIGRFAQNSQGYGEVTGATSMIVKIEKYRIGVRHAICILAHRGLERAVRGQAVRLQGDLYEGILDEVVGVL